MLKRKEEKNVEQVGNKLLDNETRKWGNLDEHMLMLDYLDDNQLCAEAFVLFREHETKHMLPDFDIPNPALLTPMMLDAIKYILSLYEDVGMFLNPMHKYILQQYLALQHASKMKFKE